MVTANEEGALTATAGRHRISPDTVRLAETEGFELQKSPLISLHKSSLSATSYRVPLIWPIG